MGDVDGDGRTEVVTIMRHKLTVYRKENQGLRTVATFESSKVERFVWVCVADVTQGRQSVDLSYASAHEKFIPGPGG